MPSLDDLMRRLGDAELDPRLAQAEAAVMHRIATASPEAFGDASNLRWGTVTAVAALLVGAAGSNLGTVPIHATHTAPTLTAGLALAPSTLLMSAR